MTDNLMTTYRRACSRPALLATMALAAAVAMGTGGTALAQGNYPEKPLEWTVPFGPGGGSDQFARMLAQILTDKGLYPQPIVVTNRAGGSGAVGWAHQFAQAGDPYQMSSTAASFFTTPLQADPGWKPQDFTPVGLLATDVQVLLVPAESPYQTLDELIAASTEKTMSVGGVSLVSTSFIAPQKLSQTSDFKFDYVSFSGQGEALAGIISGSLDVLISNPGDIIGQLEAGTLRPLAQSGETRIDGPHNFSEVPTFRELGYDVVTTQPRGILLAPGVDQAVVDYWIDAFKKVVETPEWKDYATSHFLQENFLWGDDFKAYIDTQYEEFRKILTEAGAIQ